MAEARLRINDTMISRPDLSVELRERMMRQRMKRRGGASGGSTEYRNYSSSSHTVAAHYAQTLAWHHGERGREREERRGERERPGGELREAEGQL